jgi:hypothetical protein
MVFSLLPRDLSASSLFVHCRLATTPLRHLPTLITPTRSCPRPLAYRQSDPYRLPHLDGSVLVCHRASLIQGRNRSRPFPSERSPSFRFRRSDSVVAWDRAVTMLPTERVGLVGSSPRPPIGHRNRRLLPRRAGCAEPPTDLSVRITGDPR